MAAVVFAVTALAEVVSGYEVAIVVGLVQMGVAVGLYAETRRIGAGQ